MRKLSRHTLVILAVVALSVAGIGITGAAAKSGTKVKVILSEYLVKPKVDTVSAGKVTFVAKNVGGEEHELEIFRGEDPADLPVKDDGSVDSAALEDDEVGEIEDVEPGKSKKKAFKLSAGTYILICNIVEEEEDGSHESHFEEGMVATFTVT